MKPESLWSASLSQSSSSGPGLYSDKGDDTKYNPNPIKAWKMRFTVYVAPLAGKKWTGQMVRLDTVCTYLVLFLVGLFDKRPCNLVKLPQGWNHPHRLRVSLLRRLQYKHKHTEINTVTSTITHMVHSWITVISIWVNDVYVCPQLTYGLLTFILFSRKVLIEWL